MRCVAADGCVCTGVGCVEKTVWQSHERTSAEKNGRLTFALPRAGEFCCTLMKDGNEAEALALLGLSEDSKNLK